MRNRLNRKGVTLVEIMIALVILLIVFMGLIQASLLVTDNNAVSLLRDEAVRLGATTMTALRASPFDDMDRNSANDALPLTLTISSTGTSAQQTLARNLGINTQRTVRNVLTANYVVLATITSIDANNKQIDVTVRWDWKERTAAGGNPYTHRVVSLVRRP